MSRSLVARSLPHRSLLLRFEQPAGREGAGPEPGAGGGLGRRQRKSASALSVSPRQELKRVTNTPPCPPRHRTRTLPPLGPTGPASLGTLAGRGRIGGVSASGQEG